MLLRSAIAVGGESLLSLPFAFTPGRAQLAVRVNGVERGFTETSPTSITLASPLTAGDQLELRAKLPSLFDSLPSTWRSDPTMTALVDVFDDAISVLYADQRAFADVFSILRAPAKYLPYLAHKVGWDLLNPGIDPALADATRTAIQRKVVRLIVPLYRQKGTIPGMVAILRLFFGVEATVRAAWAGGWHLGVDRLGQTTRLCPDPAVSLAGAVTILVQLPRQFSDAEIDLAKRLLDIMKPAKAVVRLVQPTPDTWWRLGSSRLGMSGWGAYTFRITAHEGDARFDLPIPYALGQGRLAVTVNGSPVAFEETSTRVITLTTPLHEGDVLVVVYGRSTVLAPSRHAWVHPP